MSASSIEDDYKMDGRWCARGSSSRMLGVMLNLPLLGGATRDGDSLGSDSLDDALDAVESLGAPALAGVSALGLLPRVAPLADADELPVPDPHRPPWPGRQVMSGGVTLHVRETPGPADQCPVVYVHGLSGSATNWTDLAAQLAPHAPGTAVDLPGFGLSRPLMGGRYSLNAHADAVLCFLAGQGGQVHLVGNSLGGTVALMLAARRPELVRTLTLLAPAMPDRRPDPRRVSDPRAVAELLPWVRRRSGRRRAPSTPRQRVEQMIALCFGDPTLALEHRITEAAEEAVERAHQPWAREALVQTTLGMFAGWFGGARLWSVAAGVTTPTLVVWGGRDRLVSPKLAVRTTRTLPAGRLLALPHVGHIPQIEQPVTVARAVLGMWRAVELGHW
jgi:pimeloyl-ACP methyl ester carboxylesterase